MAGPARTSTKFPGRPPAPLKRPAEHLLIPDIPLLLEAPVKSGLTEQIKNGWGGGGTKTPQPNAKTCFLIHLTH